MVNGKPYLVNIQPQKKACFTKETRLGRFSRRTEKLKLESCGKLNLTFTI